MGADMFPEWITLQQREGCDQAFRRVTFHQDRLILSPEIGPFLSFFGFIDPQG